MPISDNGITTVVSQLQIGQDSNAVLLRPSGGALLIRNAADSSAASETAGDTTLATLAISSLKPSSPAITAGSGTGITVNNVGEVRRLVYSVTATYAAFSAAATTADKTIATLPAKTRLVGIVADCTTAFTGGAVSAASLKIGSSAGGTQFLALSDVFTSAATYGLADADLGTALVRSAAVLGGTLPSWSSTTTVNARITTTTANTNALTAGSVTVYLVCEVYP